MNTHQHFLLLHLKAERREPFREKVLEPNHCGFAYISTMIASFLSFLGPAACGGRALAGLAGLLGPAPASWLGLPL
ncbi:hypothetical protein, partial [Saprospira grandis]|uniref:hypothetical protein n=1 Tax=Saprospira grandis TaxID=1008 RepID=UPI001C12857C